MATYLNFPFDAELFSYGWKNFQDPTKLAMIQSGAIVQDSLIASLISNGSDYYTFPYYAASLTGEPANYDGATDVPVTETNGASASGIVYGRTKGFMAKDFIADYNSGADPMGAIIARVARYWLAQDQKHLLGILSAVFGILGNADWSAHTTNIAAVTPSTGTATVTDANKMGETTMGDAMQLALGDNKDLFSMAIMHSRVAQNLANMQLLEYWKGTDANGIQRPLNIASCNGLTVIIDDGVPVAASSAVTGEKEYTTYLFGNGAIHTADAPVDHPVSTFREEIKNGGQETLVTRVRKTIHPTGFSFTKPSSGYTASPTLTQLSAAANWSIVDNPKNIAMARIVTNG